jgi:hypothetical protein
VAIRPVQAKSRGLSAFFSLHIFNARRFKVHAGPTSSNVAPAGADPLGQRDRARHPPRSFSGALRGSAPFEGVARDAQRLVLRGRLSPSKYAGKPDSTINLDCVVITWLSTDAPQGVR